MRTPKHRTHLRPTALGIVLSVAVWGCGCTGALSMPDGGDAGPDPDGSLPDDSGTVGDDGGVADDGGGSSPDGGDDGGIGPTRPAPECVDPPEVEPDGPLDCSGSAGAAVLPQEHAYQVTLRSYLACFTESDFDFPLAEMRWEPSHYEGDPELLHRQWIALRQRHSNLPDATVLRTDAVHYTLDAIEGDGTVRVFEDGPEAMSFWVGADLPGNPYHDVDAVRRRAFATAAVDMMMLDDAHESDAGIRRSDFLGGSLLAWAYTYRHVKELLPTEIRQAFEAGLLRHLSKLEDWGPRDVNTNMDTKTVAAMAELGQVVCASEVHTRTVEHARRVLFGTVEGTPETSDFESGIFHPAGYVGEADGPETTYNGISLLHLTEAAIITRGDPAWDAFMPEVLRRMTRFKTHQMFPDVDGNLDGPSSFAKRTAESYADDQRAKWYRNRSVAMLSDEGLSLLSHRGGGIPTVSEMDEETADGANSLNVHRDFGVPSDATPEPWSEDHWRAEPNFGFDHYMPGSYERFTTRADRGDPLLELPFERDVDFDIDFDEEFWSSRTDSGEGDWGFFVETVRDAGWGYDRGYLGGGGVAELWTARAGTIIRGRTRGNSGGVDPRDTFDTVRNWAANHMWGIGDGGVPFSTAKNRETESTYDLSGDPPTVTVRGAIGDDDGSYDYERWAPDGALAGPVEYSRTFERLPDGLRVTAELNTNSSSETVGELWENIPIFLWDDARQDRDTVGARVELRVDGEWRDADASETTVDAIRVTRFGESAYILLDRARTVRLADGLWTTDYQTRDRIQVVWIDMLEGAGPALDGPRTITWTASLSE